MAMEKCLDLRDGMGSIVDHRGNQGGVGLSPCEDIEEVLRSSRTAGGDDGNAHMTRYQVGQIDFVTILCPVGIDGVQADLACSEALRLFRPPKGVDAGC